MHLPVLETNTIRARYPMDGAANCRRANQWMNPPMQSDVASHNPGLQCHALQHVPRQSNQTVSKGAQATNQ
jgi:hypothetical protein